MYRAHYRPVLSYALRRTSQDAAQDAVAETFLVAWRRFEEVPGDAFPWLVGVTRRVLATQRRSAKRRDALLERVIDEARANESRPDVGRALEFHDRPIVEAVRHLPEHDQEALILVAWDGLDHRQAAAAVGCSPLAFRVRIHRARRRLREALEALEVRENEQLNRDPVAPQAGKP